MTHHKEDLAPRKPMESKEYTCIVCSSIFVSNASGNPPQYCSNDCYKVRRRELNNKRYVPKAKLLEVRNCLVCGSEFQPTTKSNTLCKQQTCVALRNLEKSRRHEVRRRETTEEAKDLDLRKRYGITLQEWNEVLTAWNYSCAICERKDVELFVDHCHTSGKVRGPLCRTCNAGIGMLKDDIKLLRKAIDYLED